MKLETKSFAFKLDAPPDDEGNFTGYAAVFGNVDKGNDVIEPGATTKTLRENPEVPVFWVHNYVKVPIGIGTMTQDTKGVRLDAKLFLETSELAREVFGAMKAGAVKGLSIGYNTLKRYFKGAVRHLQEIAIGEVSLCPFPMNPLANVDGVKDLYGYETTEGVASLLTAIRSLADFLVEEVKEGDTADASAAQDILNMLSKLLASEIAELATAPVDAPQQDAPPAISYDEAMSAVLDNAIKSLTALQMLETASEAATGEVDDDPERVEPALATLRDLASALSR